MQCSRCNNEVMDTDTFCGQCGSTIVAPRTSATVMPEVSQNPTTSLSHTVDGETPLLVGWDLPGPQDNIANVDREAPFLANWRSWLEENFAAKLAALLALIVVAFIITAIVAYQIGKAVEHDMKLDAGATASLAAQKAAEDSELHDTQAKLQDTQAKIAANQTQLARLDNYESKISTLESAIKEKKDKVSDLNGEIGGKQYILERLTRAILRARAAPFSLPAGEYTVGTDIQPGRYSVNGSSNFYVRDSGGETKVNTILGYSGVGVGNYVCNLEDGDKIETDSYTTFQPLEKY